MVSLRFAPFAMLLLNWCGSLGHSALVIKGEQTAQDFLAGHMADCVADAVVLGQGLNFLEVVTQVEDIPAVGVADGFIKFPVQAVQFEDTLVARFCLLL